MARKPPTILPGTRYGHLVTTGIYKPEYMDGNKKILGTVECICDCGSLTSKRLYHLKNGMAGCCSKKCIHNGYFTHRKAKHINGKIPKEYGAWMSMKHSCDNPSNPSYKYIGGKGITYHESLSTIEGFLEVVGIAPSKYHRLTRIDKDGDYEPGNVHWYLASKRKTHR